MDIINWLSILLALVIVTAVALVLLYQYAKTQQKEIDELWFQLHLKIRKRSDMIPLLIHKVTSIISGIHTDKVLQARQKAMELNHSDAPKIAAEKELSAEIVHFMSNAEKHEEILKAPYYLALKKELNEQAEIIALATEQYNAKIKTYTKIIKFPVYRQFHKILKLPNRHIFEFEA